MFLIKWHTILIIWFDVFQTLVFLSFQMVKCYACFHVSRYLGHPSISIDYTHINPYYFEIQYIFHSPHANCSATFLQAYPHTFPHSATWIRIRHTKKWLCSAFLWCIFLQNIPISRLKLGGTNRRARTSWFHLTEFNRQKQLIIWSVTRCTGGGRL